MHRLTLHYEMYGQGWTDTFFRAAPFDANQRIFLDDFINKRLALLCTDGFIVGVRGSTVGNPRDITIYLDETQQRKGTWSAPGGATTANPNGLTQPDTVFTSLLTRLNDGGANFRSWKLLGIPDEIVAANIIPPSQNPDLRARLNAFIQSMSGAGIGMKAQGAATASGRIVKFFPKTEDNQLVCLGITGAVPAPGSYIIVGTVKGFPELNRKWKVSDSGPAAGGEPAFVFLKGSDKLNTFGPVQDGVWKAPTYALAVLNQYTVSRLSARKPGVSFTVVPGRR